MTTTSPPTPAPSATSTFISTDATAMPTETVSGMSGSEATATAATAGDEIDGLLTRLRDEALDWVREEPLKAVALAAAAGALLALCLPARPGPDDAS